MSKKKVKRKVKENFSSKKEIKNILNNKHANNKFVVFKDNPTRELFQMPRQRI